MKVIRKYLNNQKLLNGIFLSLIPLIIPSYSLLNALVVSISCLILHLICNVFLTFFYHKLDNKTYKIPVMISVFVAIPVIFAFVLSLIFRDLSSDITDICCYVVIAITLLNTVNNFKYESVKENIVSCLPSVLILSVILTVIGFIREIIGLGSFCGFKLPIGNLSPIGIFNQTSGGLLLLGIIVVIYSVLFSNGKEED